MLSARSRTRAELAGRLRERGIDDEIAGAVLDRFEAVGLIDDVAYADAFVTSRQRDRGLGRQALARELDRKGVERSVAERALQGIDAESERSRAAELVAKKLDAAMFAGFETARRRLLGMLARRGYSPTIAIDVVNEALRGYVAPMDYPDP